MVSQLEYEGVSSETLPRETQSERELRRLQSRLDQLEAEKLGLTVAQLEEKRFAEFCEQRSAPAEESDAVREYRRAVEREQTKQRMAVDHYGVPADADANLAAVLHELTTDAVSQKLFRSLVAAIAGVDPGDSDSLRDVVAWWPSLSPEVGAALAAVVRLYANTYRTSRRVTFE